MKSKCTNLIIAATVAAIPLKAVNSELRLSVSDNSPFVLTVDNMAFGAPSATYNVANLIAGMHHVQMMRRPMTPYGICGLPVVLYDGWVNIPAASRVVAVNNAIGQLNIISVTPTDPYYGYGYENGGYNNGGYGGYGNGYPYGNGGYGNNPYGTWGYPPSVPIGMPQADFDALKASIKSKSFDSSKSSLAVQAINANKMTSKQIAEIVKLMDFESTKLAVAKFGYGKAIDRQNYFMVNDAFSFDSTSTELAEYISEYTG